jgi:SAM-dependent methyltransferase
MSEITKKVQEYYGKTLQSGRDLKTNACCTFVDYPQKVKQTLSQIHDEVLTKYYGCGLTIPNVLEGLNVLDLGSGSGRDVFLLSKFVGEKGKVFGIDMTDEQLAVANKHVEYHREAFGYEKANTEFIKGDIAQIGQCGFEKNSVDLVVSNCVINLVEDKESVLIDVYNVLKEGGEFYFSDVYCDRRIPHQLQKDEVLYGECLSGALYWNDFVNLAKKVGFADPRLVESEPIVIQNTEIQHKLDGMNFYSATYRLFKVNKLEPDCEEYGQMIKYTGGIEGAENKFILDKGHVFEKDRWYSVCGNSYLMLKNTRFAKYFKFEGNFDHHYGIFKGCGKDLPFETSPSNNSISNSTSCC